MTTLKQIEQYPNHIIIVELEKDDGDAHRFSIAPGDDFSGVIVPAVNADLTSPISDDDVGKIMVAVKLAHTSDVISAYRAPQIAEANANAQPAAIVATMQDFRANAYRVESDPMLIRAQRLEWQNDPTAPQAKKDYLAMVAEIKARFPYPAPPEQPTEPNP
jgi:hypothetical protein